MTPYARDHATPSPAAQDDPAKGLEVDDLIERLRAYRPTNEWGDPCHHRICDEAADALTDHATASRQIAELDARIETLGQMYAVAAAGYQDMKARASTLEAENKGLREALVPFAQRSLDVGGLSDGVEVRLDASFALQDSIGRSRGLRCEPDLLPISVGDLRRARAALAKDTPQ